MTVQTKTEPASRQWPKAIPFALLLLLYLPTLSDLIWDWYTDANYSHGFLIPIVSLYLIWSQREQLPAISNGTSKAGLALIITGMGLFVLGSAGAEYFTARVSFVITAFGLVWYLFGNRMAALSWFAFFFLCFMIPIPYVVYYSIAFPLQVIVSKITAVLLNILGMAALRQGNVIHLAGGLALEVAEACSGMRSVMTLLALGAIYAYWSQKKLVAQLLLFGATIPIAVVANIIRVFITALLAASIMPDVSVEPMHSILGLSVFVSSFIGLFVVGQILRRLFK